MKFNCLTLLLAFLTVSVTAQLNFDYTEGKFLLKGTVADMQTKKPVPSANIKIINLGKGITCDNDGQFILYVALNDTLKFSSVGYVSKEVVVRDIDSTQYYTLEIELLRDYIIINDVVIYPYRDLAEFKKVFIEKRDLKTVLPGIPPPKYSSSIPKSNFGNPVTFFYERLRRRRAANPDFKP